MRAQHYADEIRLTGATDDSPRTERFAFLMHLLDSAGAKVNHFDILRQRNLIAALAIFAGLAGLNLRLPSILAAVFGSVALCGVMAVFVIYDRRLHRYSEGWQGTRAMLAQHIQEVINHPEREITFIRYCSSFETNARALSLHPLFFFLLALGGTAFFVVVALLGVSGAAP